MSVRICVFWGRGSRCLTLQKKIENLKKKYDTQSMSEIYHKMCTQPRRTTQILEHGTDSGLWQCGNTNKGKHATPISATSHFIDQSYSPGSNHTNVRAREQSLSLRSAEELEWKQIDLKILFLWRVWYPIVTPGSISPCEVFGKRQHCHDGHHTAYSLTTRAVFNI